MNPKLFSKAFNYYAHSHNLLFLLMRYYLEREVEDEGYSRRSSIRSENFVPMKPTSARRPKSFIGVV